jgi:very-short-patch-repair endonuclease
MKCDAARRYTTEKFIEKASKVHNGVYDYSKVEYTTSTDKVAIICKKHGEFLQQPNNHLHGQGCPLCFKEKSNIEREVCEYVEAITEEEIQFNDRTVLNGREIDIYIPSLKVGIEVDGLWWHCERFDTNLDAYRKTLDCEKLGIKLIHVFEDEWHRNKDLVKKNINRVINGEKEPIISGIPLPTFKVEDKEAQEFIDKNSLYYNENGLQYLGTYCNELSSVVGYKPLSNDACEIKSFACSPTLDETFELSSIIHGLSKQFSMIFFNMDRRYTFSREENQLTKIGFKYVRDLEPDYMYYDIKHGRERRLTKEQSEQISEENKQRIFDVGYFRMIFTTFNENPIQA